MPVTPAERVEEYHRFCHRLDGSAGTLDGYFTNILQSSESTNEGKLSFNVGTPTESSTEIYLVIKFYSATAVDEIMTDSEEKLNPEISYAINILHTLVFKLTKSSTDNFIELLTDASVSTITLNLIYSKNRVYKKVAL